MSSFRHVIHAIHVSETGDYKRGHINSNNFVK